MKNIVKAIVITTVLASSAAHAQYYPYGGFNPYDRHSVPANNYARGYAQGSFNAYTGMAVGGSAFMNGLAIGTTPQVIAVPAPGAYYGGPPPGTPYGVPVPAPAPGYAQTMPYSVPYTVPYGQ